MTKSRSQHSLHASVQYPLENPLALHTCAMAARSVTGVVARSLGRRVGARQVTAVVARRGGGGNSSAVAPPFARLPDSKTPVRVDAWCVC